MWSAWDMPLQSNSEQEMQVDSERNNTLHADE